MAAVDIAPNFGAELKDGFKPVNAWVSQGIAWLEDIQSFYRERSAIEKEYSQKLNGLAKKYYEKKARKQSTLSVGENPTVTPGSLESASMTTWGVQLQTLESRATEHDRFANQLLASLAEPLKHLATRTEGLRKHHAEYAEKLEKERDASYSDLKKSKGKYDSVCQDVENKRKKIESSFDHGKTKAQSAYLQQQDDMRNTKNTYLISINVTNKQRERYYHEYVPDLLDSLQDLSETRITKLNTIWAQAAAIETQTLTRSTELLNHLSSEIPRNNPVLDSMMFVRHNVSNWQDPPDFTFEPSPVWLDDGTMATDENSKVFLRNILLKSKSSLGECRRECDQKRKEVEGAKRTRQAIREGKDKRDEVEVVAAQFQLQEYLHEAERKKITAEIEVSTISSVVGDLSVGARNHAFKSQTFKIPTNCDLCGERIWGLSAKGFDCKDCGFTCHNKCELKVPADCPGEVDKEKRKKLKVERQAAAQAASLPVSNSNGDTTSELPRLSRSDTMGSMNTLSSGYAASAQRSVSGTTMRGGEESMASGGGPKISAGGRKNRIMAPPPDHYAADGNGLNGGGGEAARDEERGTMMYGYQQNGEGEISVDEGVEITVVEPDDGSGWMRVHDPRTNATGLVPASYVELLPPQSSHSLILPPTAADRPISTMTAASASTTSLAGSLSSSTGTLSTPGGGKKKGPAVAPKRGGKKLRYVEALFTYTATGEGETSMDAGEKLVLIAPDQGDGWVEVERQGGKGKGVVPGGWVREV